MKIQLPLLISFETLKNTPIIKKYELIFTALDLKEFPEFNDGIGADGISRHALLRAFIIRSLESLKTVSALIRFLESNPALKVLCGFRDGTLPHNTQFYRFLKKPSTQNLKLCLSTQTKSSSKRASSHLPPSSSTPSRSRLSQGTTILSIFAATTLTKPKSPGEIPMRRSAITPLL